MSRRVGTREWRPLAVVAVAGAIIGHVIGYASVGHAAGPMHEYFGPLSTASIPLAAAALVWFGVRLSRDHLDVIRVQTSLTLWMAASYIGLEALERVVGGHGLSTAEVVPILAGLAAQPIVAWALVWMASLIGRVVTGNGRGLSTPIARKRIAVLPARVEAPTRPRRRSARSSRGPPRR